MNPLQFHYKELKISFSDCLKSEWEVGMDGRRFLGYSIDVAPFLVDDEIKKAKEIIGDGFKIYYQPNNQQIIIE